MNDLGCFFLSLGIQCRVLLVVVLFVVFVHNAHHREISCEKIMRLSAASVPKAAVLVHTKETLIKTPYRELREKIVLSPDYYIIFTAQCRKKQAEHSRKKFFLRS